jgi:hypothetical protein
VRFSTHLECCKFVSITSRKGFFTRAEIDVLNQEKCLINIQKCDSTDIHTSRCLEKLLREEYPYVQQRVFAAGISSNTMLGQLSISEARKIVTTKTLSLKNSVCTGDALEIYLSSISSLWSQLGGAFYSYANMVLDSHAMSRYTQGLPAYSLQMGPFAQSGLASDFEDRFNQMGILPFAMFDVIRIFLSASGPLSVHLNFDAGRVFSAFTLKGDWNYLNKLTPSRKDRSTPEQTVTAQLQRAVSLDKIKAIFRSSLSVEDDDIDFKDIDSISAVEISKRLSAEILVDLDVTIIYDYPSITALHNFIQDLLTGNDGRNMDPVVNDASLIQLQDKILYIMQYTDLPSALGSYSDCIRRAPSNRWQEDGFKVGHCNTSR